MNTRLLRVVGFLKTFIKYFTDFSQYNARIGTPLQELFSSYARHWVFEGTKKKMAVKNCNISGGQKRW